MKKLSTLLGIVSQLCLAHGIQLAVIRVLYRKPLNDIEETHDNDNHNTEEVLDDGYCECEVDDEYFEVLCEENRNSSAVDIVDNYNDSEICALIQKVRKIVKLF